MPQGMQVFNQSGDLLIDTSTLVGQFINSFITTQNSGSVEIPIFSTGTPFAFAVTSPSLAGGDIPITPDLVVLSPVTCSIEIIGTTLYWDLNLGDDQLQSQGITIQYGVF